MPVVVFAQIFGDITHAGTVSSTASVMKYSVLFATEVEQSIVCVHLNITLKILLMNEPVIESVAVI